MTQEKDGEKTKKSGGLSDFASKIAPIQKASGADILRDMASDIHMKSDISNPLAYTVVHAIADWEEDIGEEEIAEIDRRMAIYAERFSVAKKGKRADKILEAVQSVLTQEFEIEKNKAKRLMG